MPRTTVEVRRATESDVELLMQLAARARDEEHLPPRGDVAVHRARAVAALNRSDVVVFVAAAAGEPVGAVVLRVGEVLPLCGAEAVHVEQLYVDAGWRRRGVARQLLTAAVQLADEQGVSDLVCTTPAGVREPQRFLARLGFTPLVVQRVVPLATLRRRLATSVEETGRRRAAVDLVLARRRREQRARAGVTLEARPAAGR
ncbi:MAG: GNAT family N-acetyltransferase [Actinomycetes bacterium]